MFVKKSEGDIVRLGINIDHVATVRQARGEEYPCLKRAAEVCLREGADQITIHLREDRRHIQDRDVSVIREVTKTFNRPLNLEMACNESVFQVAVQTRPDWICLVPEKREEKTTEGGLNLRDQKVWSSVHETCLKLKKNIPGLKISLFLESQMLPFSGLKKGEVDAVEIHTGDYAKAYLQKKDLEPFLKDFQRAKEVLDREGIACHAGHGLTEQSLLPLIQANIFEEYNIGHWVIAEAIFLGLGNVVRDLKRILL